MINKTPILYRVGKAIFGPIFKLYYNPIITGKENIPEDGSLIIASNHLHLLDQCPMVISTKRAITYMAKKEYFDNKLTRWFFKGVRCICVDRYGDAKDAVIEALKVLNSGGVIGIFPEGTRNKTDKLLLPFKYGAVSMAQKTNCYILPVGISGTYKFRSKDLKVRIGKPFKVSNMDIEDANKKLYNEIKKLIKKN